MENQPLWGRGAAPGRPQLAGPVRADVCVVGLGGSGLTAIDELLDLGASVIGLDARTVAAGAAGRNGGLLLAGMAPFYHDAVAAIGRERARAVYLATIGEQRRIVARTPGAARATGSLRIEDDAGGQADCDAQLDALRADGLPVERHDGPEGRGLRFPSDLTFDPLGRCRALAEHVAARGARLFERSAATDVHGNRVATELGHVDCDAVIVAVDGGLERVLPELADRVRTARLQMLGTEPARDVSLPTPMYLRRGYEYVQQLEDGRLALGGFRDHHEAAEWTDDARPTAEIQGLLEAFLRRRIGTKAAVSHRWAASVGYTDGPLPIAEEVRAGVWAVGGYSGTGNLVGALAGRAAAAAALGRPSPLRDLLIAPGR